MGLKPEVVTTHDEHRTRGPSDDLFGDTPEHEATQAPTAMGGQDDHIRAEARRRVEHAQDGVASNDMGLHRNVRASRFVGQIE